MASERVIEIEVAGGRGGYLDEGEGPPLVLIVTPFIDAGLYRPTRQALRGHFRVVTLELPGTAHHPPSCREWELEEYAQWVAAVLEALRLEGVTLVGHSNSGGVALLTGLVCPERLEAVVLTDTIGADTSHSFVDLLAGLAVCAPLELGYALRLLPRFAHAIRVHTRNFLKQFVVSVRRDLTREARRLGVPTLVAWGALDYVTPPSCVTVLMRRLPDAELFVSPRGSHDWLITLPEEFARVVRAFDSRVRGRDGTGVRGASPVISPRKGDSIYDRVAGAATIVGASRQAVG